MIFLLLLVPPFPQASKIWCQQTWSPHLSETRHNESLNNVIFPSVLQNCIKFQTGTSTYYLRVHLPGPWHLMISSSRQILKFTIILLFCHYSSVRAGGIFSLRSVPSRILCHWSQIREWKRLYCGMVRCPSQHIFNQGFVLRLYLGLSELRYILKWKRLMYNIPPVNNLIKGTWMSLPLPWLEPRNKISQNIGLF